MVGDGWWSVVSEVSGVGEGEGRRRARRAKQSKRAKGG
jgi:hypothetical protein